MCLIAFSWQPDAAQNLVLVANRDEFHRRPTAPLAWWHDAPEILAGRDLQDGGTWLGVSRQGKFAALTNYREPKPPVAVRSRGHLVADFLRSASSPLEYAETLQAGAETYAGFNLLVGDQRQLVYFSNRDAGGAKVLPPGAYGLSNALLDADWPKLVAARDGLVQTLGGGEVEPGVAMSLLQRREAYADEQLPDTGVGISMERMLSPPFICTPQYGTRSTSFLQMSPGQIVLWERRYSADGQIGGEVREQFQPR